MPRSHKPNPLLRLALALAGAASTAAAAPLPPPQPDLAPVAAVPRSNGLPEHWERGVFMEIFVRAWKDSDGDGIGDLRGLTATLDHLQWLGIRGIWLMPVSANADGDHGYATTDYRAIAPEYGTLADFDELLRQAHARGIGVIMDYVINHASAEHPMFQAALEGPANPFHRWFVWSDAKPEGWDIWGQDPWYHPAGQPWRWKGPLKDLPPPPAGARGFYFGTFGPHMPDFDFRHPPVLEYHESSLRFWLNRGLDGYRLDAVPHLVERNARDWNDQPESRALTHRLQQLIRAYPQRTVVCEATARPQEWGDPAVCGGAFAFGHVHHLVQAAQGGADTARAREAAEQAMAYWRTASPTMATFLSNHDRFAGERLWDQLGGDERRMRLAAASYLLLPGTPYVYYGEPIGQAGVPGLPGDLPLRGPLSWTADERGAGFSSGKPFRALAPNRATHNVAAQQADPDSLLHFYKAMIGLRNAHPSLARGSFRHGLAQGRVMQWQRVLDEGTPGGPAEHTLVLINHDEAAAPALVAGLPPQARLEPLWPAVGTGHVAGADGTLALRLGPQSVQVMRVVQPAPAAPQPGSKRVPARPARVHSR